MPPRLIAPITLAALTCAAAALAQSHAAQPSDSLELVATLLDPLPATPHCGTLHVAVAMRYAVVRVVRGAFPAREIYAIHGCPEMTRRTYGGPSAGTLTSFRPGDRHRLVLRRHPPGGPAGPSLWPEPRLTGVAPDTVYWTVRADPAP